MKTCPQKDLFKSVHFSFIDYSIFGNNPNGYCICTAECYSAIKRNGPLPLAARWLIPKACSVKEASHKKSIHLIFMKFKVRQNLSVRVEISIAVDLGWGEGYTRKGHEEIFWIVVCVCTV